MPSGYPGRVTTGTARRLWAHDGARLTLDRADMLDGAAPGSVELGEKVRMAPAQRLDQQLAGVGVDPGDVTHVVLSHVHFDHTGGLRHLPHARFLLGAGDRGAVDGSDPDVAALARGEDLDPVRDAAWTFVDGDLDLFGDGAPRPTTRRSG
jgi:N-acyl homoserine lactone hydrolase